MANRSCRALLALAALVHLSLFLPTAAFSQVLSGPASEPAVSAGIVASPSFLIPVGSNADLYRFRLGGRASAVLSFNRVPWISPRVDVSYSYISLPGNTTATLSLVRGSVGPQLSILFGRRVALFAFGAVGGYFGTFNGIVSATDAFLDWHAGGGVSVQLFDDVSLFVDAAYDSFLGTFESFSVSLGVVARVAGSGGGAVPLNRIASVRPQTLSLSGQISFHDVQLETVFPVLFKYYDSHPIGTALVTNTGAEELERIEIRVVPSAYIDSPKLSARIPVLSPGESTLVDLYALFNEDILDVSEGAKVVTDLSASYQAGSAQGNDQETVTLDIHDRNALKWDDDQKIAAFVTAKDDEIQRFTRAAISSSQEVQLTSLNRELQLAMLLFEAMVEQDLVYVVDPTSSYQDLSDDPAAIDYVQFPRQTLYVGAGDCDDLSATYCTLLESIGIDTAFVTIPGHIFAAFRIDMDQQEARRSFADPRDLILLEDGTVWLPVETTMVNSGFLAAWSAGARQWRASVADGNARILRTADGWRTYEPVAFSVSPIVLDLPDTLVLESLFVNQLEEFVSKQVYPREQLLMTRLETDPDNVRLRNALGVLYARYGMYEQAREQFQTATATEPHPASLVNLANIDFLEGEYERALGLYSQAVELDPSSGSALLGSARAQYELGRYRESTAAYERLAAISPGLSADYAYLGHAPSGTEARANSAVRLQDSVEWEDVE